MISRVRRFCKTKIWTALALSLACGRNGPSLSTGEDAAVSLPAPATDSVADAPADARVAVAPPLSGRWRACGELTINGGPAHSGLVWALKATPDARFVVSAAAPPLREVNVWRLDERRHVRKVPGAEITFGIDLAPDGSALATSGDGQVVYDVNSGSTLWTVDPPPSIDASGWQTSLVFAPTGDALAFAGYGDLALLSPAKGARIVAFPGAAVTSAVAFSSDGTLLATASGELWDVASRRRLWKGDPPPPSKAFILRDEWVTFSPDDARVLTSHCDIVGPLETPCVQTAHLMATKDGALVRTLDASTWPRHPAFSPDGRWLAAGDRLFELSTGNTRMLPTSAVVATFASDGTLITGDAVGRVFLHCPE